MPYDRASDGVVDAAFEDRKAFETGAAYDTGTNGSDLKHVLYGRRDFGSLLQS
jgi:hypothetical protein